MDCPRVEYEYIDIVMTDQNGARARILVDIEFRSQFELVRPTVAHAQLASILPPVFVGREAKLKKVVALLCSAARVAARKGPAHSAIPYLAAASIHELKLKGASCGGSALSSQFSDAIINCWELRLILA